MVLTLVMNSCQVFVTEKSREVTTEFVTETETEIIETTEEETEPEVLVENSMPKIDMSKWLYNEDDKVYYQIGLKYCENPVDESYQSFSIFVPNEYFTSRKNEDDTYTCRINPNGINNRYQAHNCPIVLPIETPGYSACKALTEYSDKAKTYTKEGFVYVYAGARGREHGAPLGIVDYKACIRYLKYNRDILPGNIHRIVTFGMSGGGAQSAVLGVSGNNSLFEPYLEKIGAVKGYKDDVYASMCWCPITNLDSADMAYEWMMGSTRDSKKTTAENREISQKLSDYYADYINSLELKDENGKLLKLDTAKSQSGSYYDYVVSVIEKSLNDFFVDNQFPYTIVEKQMEPINNQNKKQDKKNSKPAETKAAPKETQPSFPQFGNPNGGAFRPFAIGGTIVAFTNTNNSEEASTELQPEAIDETEEETEAEVESNNDITTTQNNTSATTTQQSTTESKSEKVVEAVKIEDIDNIVRNVVTGGVTLKGTYNTKEDYLKALNEKGEWIIFDQNTNKYKITSIADFAMAVKRANKNIAAFDQLDREQGENMLFGINGTKSHFDKYLKEIVAEGKNTKEKNNFDNDFEIVDEVGYDVETRLNMLSPMYYLHKDSKGYKTSTVAPYFRIRTGCWQSDTSLTTEINLDLMLKEYGVASDFETVWGIGHEKAERVSTDDKNFISWVNYVARKVNQ